MLQWVMDEAEGEELLVDRLVIRMMTINITAINTSSMVGPPRRRSLPRLIRAAPR